MKDMRVSPENELKAVASKANFVYISKLSYTDSLVDYPFIKCAALKIHVN